MGIMDEAVAVAEVAAARRVEAARVIELDDVNNGALKCSREWGVPVQVVTEPLSIASVRMWIPDFSRKSEEVPIRLDVTLSLLADDEIRFLWTYPALNSSGSREPALVRTCQDCGKLGTENSYFHCYPSSKQDPRQVFVEAIGRRLIQPFDCSFCRMPACPACARGFQR